MKGLPKVARASFQASHGTCMSRILIIDDERRLVESLTRALRARGLEADGAYDGERGLELALGGTYALVVLDLRLPKLNGVEVLRATMQSRPDQPVLVLSALDGVAAKVRCLEAGAADYLTKPFSIAELLARVQARLRQPSQPRTKGSYASESSRSTRLDARPTPAAATSLSRRVSSCCCDT